MGGKPHRIITGIYAMTALLTILTALAVCVPRSKAAEGASILLDGKEVSGTVEIAAGSHTITGQGEGALQCVAVFEDGRFAASSCNKALTWDFPERGAEILFFCLDSEYRPLREPVRVAQESVPAQMLLYSGEAVCAPDETGYQFEEYTVRLKVLVRDRKITAVRDVAGYDAAGAPIEGANTSFLNMAAAQMPDRIVAAQSTEGIDAVSGATFASRAITRAVDAALKTVPETAPEEDTGGEKSAVPDGVYSGNAQCLTGYMNYMVDVSVTVSDGVIAAVEDRTLRTPMSTKDREMYESAWAGISRSVDGLPADSFRGVDAVSGATLSSSGLNTAISDALTRQQPDAGVSGDVYAPEGISLYARVYPVVTVLDGSITGIRIVPAAGTDTALLEQFAGEIQSRQSVTGLTWPAEIADDAFAVANLVEQVLYGKGVLK